MRDPAGHRQPMPVLHGGMAHIAKLGLPSGRFAIKPAVGVTGARMGIVLAPLRIPFDYGIDIVKVTMLIFTSSSILPPRFLWISLLRS